MKNKGFFWHVHHNRLLEYCYDYKERVRYINTNKLSDGVSTRLRLFQPVRGKLPKELTKAGQKFSRAGKMYGNAETWCRWLWPMLWRRLKKAETKYEAMLYKHKEEIRVLHKRECPYCPWNGQTIFPAGEIEK